MKVCVYTICKNEEQNVDRWLENTKFADYRVVCDTGSIDETYKKLCFSNTQVHRIKVSPWRFDFARNTALSLVPKDTDVCVSLDLDEIFEFEPDNWITYLKSAYSSADFDQFYHWYSQNNSNPILHSKIHKRVGCRWVGEVHEELRFFNSPKTIFDTNLHLKEFHDISKDRTSYYDLLVQKSKHDKGWRTFFFLSIEMKKLNKNYEIPLLKSYELCDEHEMAKSYVARHLGNYYKEKQDFKKAEEWFCIAVTDSPEREAYFELAKFYHERKEFDLAFPAIRRCLKVTEKRQGFTFNAKAWDSSACHKILSDCESELEIR